jgi:hypothetical protein
MVVPGNPEAAAAAASSASYIAVKAEVLAKHAAAVTQLQVRRIPVVSVGWLISLLADVREAACTSEC